MSDHEPLRRIAIWATAALTLIGAVLTALVGTVDADWLAPTAVAVMAALGVVSQWGGTEAGRTQVWPTAHVEEAVDEAVAVAPRDVPVDDEPVDLDAAAKAAGLD